MEKLTLEEMEVVAKDFGDMVVGNLFWECCEAYLYRDGEMGIRPEGSFGEGEYKVIKVIPLRESYWSQYLHDCNLDLELKEDYTFMVDEIVADVHETLIDANAN